MVAYVGVRANFGTKSRLFVLDIIVFKITIYIIIRQFDPVDAWFVPIPMAQWLARRSYIKLPQGN